MKTLISTLVMLMIAGPASAKAMRFSSLSDCKARAIAKHSDLQLDFSSEEVSEETGKSSLAIREKLTDGKLSDDDVDFLMITRKNETIACTLASDFFEGGSK